MIIKSPVSVLMFQGSYIILFGVSDGVSRKLQSVLHAAARLVTGVRRNEHITPILRMCSIGCQSSSGSHTRLQWWLSVVFVVCARHITLKSVRQFRRLPDMPSYVLHAMVTSLFRPQTMTFGSRTFRSAAPTVWNSLPSNLLNINRSLGQFASGLETWLFGCAHT